MSGGRIAFDQKLARALVRPLASTPVHPNALTALGLVLGLVAAWVFATGDPGSEHIAALVYVIAIFLDHTDGELARMTGKTSRFGHYFDHVQAVSNYTVVWIGIGIGLAAKGAGAYWPTLGVVAGVSCALIFGARFAVEEILGSGHVRQKIVAGFEPEDTLYIVAPVVWLGGIEYLALAAAVGAPLGAVVTVVLTVRDLRKARAGANPGKEAA